MIQKFEGELGAVGEKSPLLFVRDKERAMLSLAVADSEEFIGVVVLESSHNAGQTWKELHRFVGTVAEPIDDSEDLAAEILVDNAEGAHIRVRCEQFVVDLDADPDPIESDEISYVLSEVHGEVVETLIQTQRLGVLLKADDRGILIAEKGLDPNASLKTVEHVKTDDGEAKTVDLSVYQTLVTTSGSEGAEDLKIGDGTGAIVGQRKLIQVAALGHASDSVVLDDANFSMAGETIDGIELDAAGEFILVEFQGAWEVIAASAGVVSTV